MRVKRTVNAPDESFPVKNRNDHHLYYGRVRLPIVVAVTNGNRNTGSNTRCRQGEGHASGRADTEMPTRRLDSQSERRLVDATAAVNDADIIGPRSRCRVQHLQHFSITTRKCYLI